MITDGTCSYVYVLYGPDRTLPVAEKSGFESADDAMKAGRKRMEDSGTIHTVVIHSQANDTPVATHTTRERQ